MSHITCLFPQPPTPHFFAGIALNCALAQDEDLERNSYNFMKQEEKCGKCVFLSALSDPFKLPWLGKEYDWCVDDGSDDEQEEKEQQQEEQQQEEEAGEEEGGKGGEEGNY